MPCTSCQTGHFDPGTTTVFLERDETNVIIKEVPASVCHYCGEYLLDETASRRVLQLISSAHARGVTLELLRYAA